MAEPYNFSIVDHYRVFPRPRWGYDLPPHPQIHAALNRDRATYAATLNDIAAARAVLHAIPHDADPNNSLTPFWNNPWFTALDAAALVGLLLARKPPRFLEIGSGNSTMFAAHAIRAGLLNTKILSIDPAPRADIDTLCDARIRGALEMCAIDIFDELQPGDICFFDGSHRVFQNSDATVFLLDVLPRLKPGILVHIHDICLPWDYPNNWLNRVYSEQYLLAAMLLGADPPFRVVMPNHFVSTDPELSARVKQIFTSPLGGRDIPFLNQEEQNFSNSFWIETTGVKV